MLALSEDLIAAVCGSGGKSIPLVSALFEDALLAVSCPRVPDGHPRLCLLASFGDLIAACRLVGCVAVVLLGDIVRGLVGLEEVQLT